MRTTKLLSLLLAVFASVSLHAQGVLNISASAIDNYFTIGASNLLAGNLSADYQTLVFQDNSQDDSWYFQATFNPDGTYTDGSFTTLEYQPSPLSSSALVWDPTLGVMTNTEETTIVVGYSDVNNMYLGGGTIDLTVFNQFTGNPSDGGGGFTVATVPEPSTNAFFFGGVNVAPLWLSPKTAFNGALGWVIGAVGVTTIIGFILVAVRRKQGAQDGSVGKARGLAARYGKR